MQEGEGLIVGRRYKVRLKPLEELVGVVEECHLRATWFKDYMDGQVGVLHYGRVAAADDDDYGAYKVIWADTYWHYRLEWLKVLGEVD